MPFYHGRSKVCITAHARMRLKERLPEMPSDQYDSFVSAARNKGLTLPELRIEYPHIYYYVNKHFAYSNKGTIIYYKHCVFVFQKTPNHVQKLCTFVNLYNENVDPPA